MEAPFFDQLRSFPARYTLCTPSVEVAPFFSVLVSFPAHYTLCTPSVGGVGCSSSDDVSGADGDDDCGGCCFAGLCSFVGEPRGEPDINEPHGGWGYTPCCSAPMHFDCLGQHLNPFDKLVESTSGEVQMELGCPACRGKLSRSRRRMLGGGKSVSGQY